MDLADMLFSHHAQIGESMTLTKSLLSRNHVSLINHGNENNAL